MSNIPYHGKPVCDGPWTNEPDHVAFEHAGHPCIIHRGPSGCWCGYVAVPPGHPWHGTQGDDCSVHGGITYGNLCRGDICHVPKPGEPDDVYWLGFDCHHYMDASPHEITRGERDFGAVYRDQRYVTYETQRLAEQAAARSRP